MGVLKIDSFGWQVWLHFRAHVHIHCFACSRNTRAASTILLSTAQFIVCKCVCEEKTSAGTCVKTYMRTFVKQYHCIRKNAKLTAWVPCTQNLCKRMPPHPPTPKKGGLMCIQLSEYGPDISLESSDHQKTRLCVIWTVS